MFIALNTYVNVTIINVLFELQMVSVQNDQILLSIKAL